MSCLKKISFCTNQSVIYGQNGKFWTNVLVDIFTLVKLERKIACSSEMISEALSWSYVVQYFENFLGIKAYTLLSKRVANPFG